MFQLFQHQYARAFAHHKTVAPFVPRTGGCGGVVVAGGQGFHGGKSAHAEHADCAFRAAGHHHVHIAVFDEPCGIADGVRTGSTGGNDAVIVPAVAFQDGDVSRNQVDERAGDEERVDFADTAFKHCFGGGFNGRQPADTRTDVHAYAVFV